MKISFVRTEGNPDRVYVTRTDGTETSWAFPTYGNVIPHDLVHLLVEAGFELRQGFWRRVDAGVDVERINAEANRKGGAARYAKFGSDQTELFLAELLAATRWTDEALTDDNLLDNIVEACQQQALSPPGTLSTATIRVVRTTIAGLCREWMNLLPKGALTFSVDPSHPESGLEIVTGHFGSGALCRRRSDSQSQ